MLQRAARRNRLAHAYLFLGPRGIGKKLVARTLTQALFCGHSGELLDACGECPSCKQVRSLSHPDLFEIGCPEGKRELPIDLMIGSKERRGREGLCHDLALRPMSADRRVAIIDDAEAMNEESANALLKTLEEPPDGSLLILIAPDADTILSTIRSRCQPLWFSPLTAGDVESILIDEGVKADDARAVAALSQGSVEIAKRLLDPDLDRLRSAVRTGLDKRGGDSLGLTSQVLEAIEQSASDTAAQRELAGWAIQFAIEHFREALGADYSDSPDQEAAACDRAAASISRCVEASGHLHQSMPVPLCLSGLFDELSRIGRTGQATRV
jgi:DNA polymerase-3 subunit delta'